MKKDLILGRRFRNDNGKATVIPFMPGMKLRNSNGDVLPSELGFQYTIQTTTQIRDKVIAQKFYEVPPSDFMTVKAGTGAWKENIKTNLTFDVAGDFEEGIIGTAQGPSQLAQVSTAISPMTTYVATWAKGYAYTLPELEMALAADNWDVVEGLHKALKRNHDLGVQKIAFLGRRGDLTRFPGLITNGQITIDTTTITMNISAMDADEFQTFVSNVIAVYRTNSNETAMPNKFAIPMADYVGLAAAASPSFPMVSKLKYLLDAFREITGNPNFQILPLAYANADRNAAYLGGSGKYRYTLYNDNPDTLLMDVPVPFNMLAPNTGNNFQWNGVGYAQFSSPTIFRPREVIYFDHD